MTRPPPASSDRPALASVPLLVALALRPLPLLPLEFALSLLLQRICKDHPRIFDRLGAHAHKRFGIKPTDLPFAFVLEPAPPRPRLTVVRELPADLDARISSSLPGLFGLVEGSLDGDALMFSRDLIVEGDVEAVLALRNAIDNAQLDVTAEIAATLGPFGEPLKQVMRAARSAPAPAAAPAAAPFGEGGGRWN